MPNNWSNKPRVTAFNMMRDQVKDLVFRLVLPEGTMVDFTDTESSGTLEEFRSEDNTRMFFYRERLIPYNESELVPEYAQLLFEMSTERVQMQEEVSIFSQGWVEYRPSKGRTRRWVFELAYVFYKDAPDNLGVLKFVED